MPDWRAETRRAAQRYGLDPSVFSRQIQQESGFNPGARSGAGALGIAQIMPATARGWGVNPMDPKAALNAAAKNMRSYVDQFGGSYEKALRAYNAGPGNVERSKSFAETNNYVATILGGTHPRSSSRTPTSSQSPETSSSTTTTAPGVDNSQARAALVQSFLGSKSADPVDFALQFRGLADVPGQQTTTTQQAPATASPSPSAGGHGQFKISGPNPGRLKPELVSFAKKVANVYGGPLEGLDGSTHSKMTVNGNVSEHYTGNATDIFKIGGKPARGQTLIQAGRAALIAAGMPRSQAMKVQGGLFNVGRHQIIFNTHEGGDHTDHLHVSSH